MPGAKFVLAEKIKCSDDRLLFLSSADPHRLALEIDLQPCVCEVLAHHEELPHHDILMIHILSGPISKLR